MAWLQRGPKNFCDDHNYEWVRADGVSCPTCAGLNLPLPTPESDWSPPTPPEGCRSSTEYEKWLTAVVSYCEEQARKLAGGVPGARGRPNYSAGIKYMELALKAARNAADLTQTRERREYVKHLRKHAEKLRRGKR